MQNKLSRNRKTTPDRIVLSIPHASTFLPDRAGYTSEELVNDEISLLTDWYADKIFEVPNINAVKATVSRIYCDVERLSDDAEPMSKFGMGIIYNKTDRGQILRQIDNSKKQEIIRKYYNPFHKALEDAVSDKLKEYGECLIIDCHTYSDQPFKRDLDQAEPRADICIGTDEIHTPPNVTDTIINFFTKRGFSVKENSPYVGCIVPRKYYQNPNVHSVMIEINRKLYMTDNKVNWQKIAQLHNIISELYNYL